MFVHARFKEEVNAFYRLLLMHGFEKRHNKGEVSILYNNLGLIDSFRK